MAAILQLFFGLEAAEVLEIKTTAVNQFKAGKVLMEVSSGGKTGRSQFPMSPRDVIVECNAALKHIDPETYGKRRRYTVSRVQSCPYGY